MNCIKCGAVIPDGQPFCPMCGAQVAPFQPVEVQYQQVPPAQYKPQAYYAPPAPTPAQKIEGDTGIISAIGSWIGLGIAGLLFLVNAIVNVVVGVGDTGLGISRIIDSAVSGIAFLAAIVSVLCTIFIKQSRLGFMCASTIMFLGLFGASFVDNVILSTSFIGAYVNLIVLIVVAAIMIVAMLGKKKKVYFNTAMLLIVYIMVYYICMSIDASRVDKAVNGNLLLSTLSMLAWLAALLSIIIQLFYASRILNLERVQLAPTTSNGNGFIAGGVIILILAIILYIAKEIMFYISSYSGVDLSSGDNMQLFLLIFSVFGSVVAPMCLLVGTICIAAIKSKGKPIFFTFLLVFLGDIFVRYGLLAFVSIANRTFTFTSFAGLTSDIIILFLLGFVCLGKKKPSAIALITFSITLAVSNAITAVVTVLSLGTNLFTMSSLANVGGYLYYILFYIGLMFLGLYCKNSLTKVNPQPQPTYAPYGG